MPSARNTPNSCRALQLQGHQGRKHADERHQRGQQAQGGSDGKGAVEDEQRLVAQGAIGAHEDALGGGQFIAKRLGDGIRVGSGFQAERERGQGIVLPQVAIVFQRQHDGPGAGGVIVIDTDDGESARAGRVSNVISPPRRGRPRRLTNGSDTITAPARTAAHISAGVPSAAAKRDA